MKILIFGRGVIGTLYGWALEKAGHSVEFYVRPGRAAEYGSVLPLKFYDARTKLNGELVEENWAIRMREDLPADHDYELIQQNGGFLRPHSVIMALRARDPPVPSAKRAPQAAKVAGRGET